MELIDAKLLHYQLNLDYSYANYTIENQSNLLISHEINKFINQFKDVKDKYFIFDFKNDNISLIGYHLLKIIQHSFNFPLLIYGKKRKIKTFLKKSKSKEKFISTFTLNRLIKKDRAIIISPYNPIYQVEGMQNLFKEMNIDYYICKQMTPDEIKTIQNFYAITDNTIDIDNDRIKCYNDFCNGKQVDDLYFNINKPKEIPIINIIKMTGNNEIDNELVNQVVHKNELIFYQCEKSLDEYPILISSYQFFLENKTNVPGYWNINQYDLVYEIKSIYKSSINFIGDFTDEEKSMWEDEGMFI